MFLQFLQHPRQRSTKQNAVLQKVLHQGGYILIYGRKIKIYLEEKCKNNKEIHTFKLSLEHKND